MNCQSKKVDYPYCTRVLETSEIRDSIKSQADVDDYYNTYGRSTFIWHKTWEDAYTYVTKEIKRQKKYLQDGLKQYRETENNLKIQNKIKKLQEKLV